MALERTSNMVKVKQQMLAVSKGLSIPTLHVLYVDTGCSKNITSHSVAFHIAKDFWQ